MICIVNAIVCITDASAICVDERSIKGPEFLVFAIVALIIERTQPIMKSCSSESDVVHMFCNLKINVWHMIEEARFIREKWLSITAGGN